jgi:capsular exopolysaccharide synthesis family protein
MTGAADALTVTAVPQSQLLSVRTEARTPARAQELANAYVSVFADKVRVIGSEQPASGAVSVAEPASRPTSPSRPRPLLYLAVGALLAALAGIAAALVRDRFDQRLQLDGATTEVLGLPIIGRLPRGERRGDGGPAVAEAARLLLANLAFANLGERPPSVAFVSAGEQEGKSTCSLSVGRAGAELGLDVLIVEADLRRPSLLDKLGLPPSSPRTGFAAALLRPERGFEHAGVAVPGSTVKVLPAGAIPPNPAALLGSDRLAAFAARAREAYDLTIYDTPPLSAGADASLVAAHAEGVVLVVDAVRTRRVAAVQAVEQLRRTRVNILGVVVNRAPDAVDAYYYAARDGAALPGAEELALEDDRPVEPARSRGLRR